MRNSVTLLRRFFSKLVQDILPAALASLIGGFLLSHYGLNGASQFHSMTAAPASTEMMQLLDEEHALVASYLKTQLANEKRQLAAEDDAPKAVAEAATSATVLSQPPATAIGAAKATSRGRSPVVGASLPALVIAQASPSPLQGTRLASDDSAKPVVREDNSLIARTIGIKERVIAVTQRAVSTIGNIPAWFGTIGERTGGEKQEFIPRPSADLVRAS